MIGVFFFGLRLDDTTAFGRLGVQSSSHMYVLSTFFLLLLPFFFGSTFFYLPHGKREMTWQRSGHILRLV